MEGKLEKQLQQEFWKIGNTIFWSLNAVILLTIILDILILSKDWLDFVLLKLFLLVVFYFTFKVLKSKYGTPNLLIHLILFSFNFLALISISYAGIGNRLLYTTLLIALFVGFNTMAIWSQIHSFIQYILVVITFSLLCYTNIITDPVQILDQGGYVFLLLGFVSMFFPKIRESILKERIKSQIGAEEKINYLENQLSDTANKYEVIQKKVKSKENEYKFLFQQISDDLNKFESILKEIQVPEYQNEKKEDLSSLLQNLRNQSSVYFKPINLNPTTKSFLTDSVDIRNVYLQVFKSFRNQMLKKELNVIEDITNTRFLITANERMFNTVLYNILNFVVIFSNEKDEIEIKLQDINNTIVFNVANKTCGLDTSEIESYFRDVEFVNYDHKKHSDSVKIGLRISKQLTEKMNGYFSYVSSEKMGYELKIQFSINK